jgi:hypothetical protein
LSEQKVCKCQKSPTILKYEVGKWMKKARVWRLALCQKTG